MKNFILVISILIFSTLIFRDSVFAKSEQIITEISFKDNVKSHKYTLMKDGSKPTYRLIFIKNKNKPIVKLVSENQMEFIKSEATRIVWNSNYRKPVHVQQCNLYAEIISGDEKTKVCTENKKATGMTYGLLNFMSRIFGIR